MCDVNYVHTETHEDTWVGRDAEQQKDAWMEWTWCHMSKAHMIQ